MGQKLQDGLLTNAVLPPRVAERAAIVMYFVL